MLLLFLVSEESCSVVAAQVQMGNSLFFPSGTLFPLEVWGCGAVTGLRLCPTQGTWLEQGVRVTI